MPDIPLETDPEAAKKVVATNGQVLCHWVDFAGQPSSMFYILGPFDSEATKDRFPVPEEAEEPTAEERRRRAELAFENSLVHFGKVEVPGLELSKLYQDTRDLIAKMQESEALSSEKNTRDRKGYKQTYD